ncbi:hypothetical protein [Nostoc sp.]|uniref:hypothetical protein n=1 Tax=Nostoc sp. TaxID=1180 RepID=UPI002FF8F667
MQLRKDIEQLYKIQQRLVHVPAELNKNLACVEVAYTSLRQAIEALEKLEDIIAEG